jgi:hypothetical protein
MVSWTMSRSMLSTSPSVLLTYENGCVGGCGAVVLEKLDPQVLVEECSCVVVLEQLRYSRLCH